MTQPRITRRALGVALAASAVVGLPARAEPTKLKLASFEPPMARITAGVLTPFAKDASAASKGTIDIGVFAGGTLGRNPTQQLKLVLDGVADLAWIVLGYTPGRFDDSDVVGLPFVTTNATEASVALHRLYKADALVGFNGLKMLAVASTPPVAIHGKQPVRSAADLKGKRVRVSGDHMTRVVEALGGAPVLVGGGQIAEAMSRGVIDLTLNNWGFVGDFKVNEVTSEHFEMPLGAVAVGVVMRQDRFDALPREARDALEKTSGEALARKIGEAFDQQDLEVRERMAKSGRNQVVKATPEQIAEWRRLIDPVNKAWVASKPRNQRLFDLYMKELQRVRSGS